MNMLGVTHTMLAPPSVNHSQSGFVVLLSTLIVLAISIGIGASLLVLAISSTQTSFALEQSNQAKGLATTCAEEALQQIIDASFVGTGNIAAGHGTCTYTVTDTGSQTRLIESEGVVESIVRRVRVNVDAVDPGLGIARWEEVADF